jgi:hypothetical protein
MKSKFKLHRPPNWYKQLDGQHLGRNSNGVVRFAKLFDLLLIGRLIGTNNIVRFSTRKKGTPHEVSGKIANIEPVQDAPEYTNLFLYNIIFQSGKSLYYSIDNTSMWHIEC